MFERTRQLDATADGRARAGRTSARTNTDANPRTNTNTHTNADTATSADTDAATGTNTHTAAASACTDGGRRDWLLARDGAWSERAGVLRSRVGRW